MISPSNPKGVSGHTKSRTCKTCGGTGWQWLNRSMFIADGYRKERCGICAGSGQSTYPGESNFVRSQAARRAAQALVLA